MINFPVLDLFSCVIVCSVLTSANRARNDPSLAKFLSRDLLHRIFLPRALPSCPREPALLLPVTPRSTNSSKVSTLPTDSDLDHLLHSLPVLVSRRMVLRLDGTPLQAMDSLLGPVNSSHRCPLALVNNLDLNSLALSNLDLSARDLLVPHPRLSLPLNSRSGIRLPASLRAVTQPQLLRTPPLLPSSPSPLYLKLCKALSVLLLWLLSLKRMAESCQLFRSPPQSLLL